jgi:hypothetical protein
LYLKIGHNLYKKDPYDKRLIKAIIIKLLGKKNEERCERYEDKKGVFMSCTSIKS